MQAASARWDQLAATLLRVPRLFERKQPQKVTMANGKPGVKTSRGTLPAKPLAAAVSEDDDEDPEWNEQEDEQQDEQEEEQQEEEQQEEEEEANKRQGGAS